MVKYKQVEIFKNQVDNLATNQATKLGMRFGLGALGVSLIYLGIRFHQLPPEVPLWYSRPYGAERLIVNYWLGLLPLVSLIVQVITMQTAGAVIETDKLLAQILVWVGSITSVLNLIALVKIISLVT